MVALLSACSSSPTPSKSPLIGSQSPDPSLIHARIARKLEAGDFEGAYRDAREAREKAPGDATLEALYGYAAALNGSVDDGTSLLDKLIARDQLPQGLPYLFRGAIKQRIKNDLDGAIRDYSEAIRRGTCTFMAYNSRAQAFLDLGRTNEALEDARHSVALEPTNPHGHLREGLVWIAQGETGKGIECLDQSIHLSPNSVPAYIARGEARTKLGKPNDAIEDFSRAIELAPAETSALRRRGGTLLNLGQFQASLADFDQVVHLKPKDAEAYVLRSQARKGLGDTEGMLRDLDTAISLDSMMADAFQFRAIYWANLHKEEQALPDAKKAAELAPKDPEVYLLLGGIEHRLKKHADAVQHLTRAIELSPELADAYYYRGYARKKLGDEAGAKEDLEESKTLETLGASAPEEVVQTIKKAFTNKDWKRLFHSFNPRKTTETLIQVIATCRQLIGNDDFAQGEFLALLKQLGLEIKDGRIDPETLALAREPSRLASKVLDYTAGHLRRDTTMEAATDRVSNLVIKGDRATATFIHKDGARYDGKFILIDGRWYIDY